MGSAVNKGSAVCSDSVNTGSAIYAEILHLLLEIQFGEGWRRQMVMVNRN